MESGNEALFRELALNEEFFACGMKKYESALIDYGVSHDNTLLKRVATDICMSLGYPDDVSISHISGIIEDNHMDNYYHSEAQTTEHPIITPIMNDNNQPTNEQTSEQRISIIVGMATSRGSRIASSIEAIRDIKGTYQAYAKIYTLAKNICKRLNTPSEVESFALTIDACASDIIDAVNEIKQTAKPRTAGGIVYDACVQYGVSLVRGDILRSNRVASSLEGCALRLCASRGIDGTIVMSEALDKALNKVYAAVRSQAKTNGVEIGGKSNTATKSATKAVILAELLRLKSEDSYQFDVIIGEVRPLSGQ